MTADLRPPTAGSLIKTGSVTVFPLRQTVKSADMIKYFERDGNVSFQVYVVARASRSEIAGEHNGALRVRLAAPPVNGAANRELIALLAKTLRVPRSAVAIDSGHSSRTKRVTVSQSGSEFLNALQLLESR